MAKRISGRKLKLNSENLLKQVIKKRKKYNHKLPVFVGKNFEVDELKDAGFKSYRLIPKDGFDGEYIIYLYGSCMCHNISNEQWQFITNIALESGKGLYVPMYPLAPENSCRELFNMLCKSYSNFTMGRDVEKVILMGDSSGAGLALSLSIVAWKEGLRKPDQLIMLSPALDTEFFDKELESKVLECVYNESEYFFSEGAKEFINNYWVKDYAVKTEYTSPYYEDYTDICDDVVLFSGTYDMFNCYAREFYRKAKNQGLNVRFFEFEEEKHNFLIHSDSENRQRAYKYLMDVICGTYNASLLDIFPLKLISEWSKNYPEIIKDDWTSKFIYDNKKNIGVLPKKRKEYKQLLMAARYNACDTKVKKYIMQHPNCTIVNIGCRLDNMFNRVDNGRIRWYSLDTHNTMAVRRAMYGENPRETTVGRSETDLSWIEEVNCDRKQGILFVCNDAFNYMSFFNVKMMFELLRSKFPGCEVVFTTSTSGATFFTNMKRGKDIYRNRQKRFFVNDAQKTPGEWEIDYKIMSEEPLCKYLNGIKGKKMYTKIAMGYNAVAYNHKIIHVKLGSEKYDLKI